MSRLDDIRVMLARNVVQPTANAPADLSFRSLSAEALAERVGSFRGSPTAHRQAHAARMAGSALPSQRIEAILDGHAVACGQCVQQDDLVGLYDIFTTEAMRGRGIATALCNELLRIAIGQGAQHAYLQVDADISPHGACTSAWVSPTLMAITTERQAKRPILRLPDPAS